MGGSELNSKPGKTAPRLLKDLIEYDPRRARKAGQNILVDPPPFFTDPEHWPIRVSKHDCRHKLYRKHEQTRFPPVDHQPEPNSTYVSSSYCGRCLWHFEVKIDFTRQSEKRMPCRLSTQFPLHHLQHVQSRRREEFEVKSLQDYDRWREKHLWRCTAPNCPAVVEITLSPPRLDTTQIQALSSPELLELRGKKTIASDPERYANSVPSVPIEALGILRQYLCDALRNEQKRVAVRNKRFLLAFSSDCDEIFRYLGFVLQKEDNEAGGQDAFWAIPLLPPTSSTLQFKTSRDFIDDVVTELAQRIVDLSIKSGIDPAKALKTTHSPILAWNDMLRVLGTLNYPQDSRVVDIEKGDEHPHYAGLGVVSEFNDSLILFAYHRQRKCDPENKPYYLECLEGIATGRESADLDEERVKARSLDEETFSAINDAYRYFGIEADVHGGDEHIIGLYESRIESAPRQAEEARACLLTIGRARGSKKILEKANTRKMTFEQACQILDVSQDTDADMISAAATIAVDDDKSGAKKLAQALRVIGEKRSEFALIYHADMIESGGAEPTLSVADAYKRLQINDSSMPDETVLTYFKSLADNAAPGSKQSYLEALHVIAQTRDSIYLKNGLNNPNGEMVVPQGSMDRPVGLDNIGNTCYLNSLLQYYYTVKAVREVVMHFEDYRMPLNTQTILNKRVGGRAISKGEIEKAQRFVEELRTLFQNLKGASTRSVKPTQDLAELTLFSTATEANFRRHSISSPAAPSAASMVNGPFQPPDGPPPMPVRPPPEGLSNNGTDIEMVDERRQQQSAIDDDGSDTTLVDYEQSLTDTGNEQLSNGSRGTKSQIDVSVTMPETVSPEAIEDDLMILDKAASDNHENVIEGVNPVEDQHGIQTAQESLSKIATRERPTPIQTTGKNEDALRAERLKFGAQQDVTEVIGNVMFRLQCAIKPTSIDRQFGEQIDTIRETFYGANAVYLKKGENYDKKVEDWANIIVFPSSNGPRSIYEALDIVFDEQIVEVDRALTSQYASISKLPPILQIQIQRTAFDSATQQPSKNQNPIIFDETIYLDRYMDSAKTMPRRKEAWKWKMRLNQNEAREKALKITKTNLTVPEALHLTKEYLEMLQQEGIEGIPIIPELGEALEERAAEITSEMAGITSETATLRQQLQEQFTDMREHRYRLQAVFIHRGTSSYGHYWIYIYDFAHDIWREYNDERVTEVKDRKQVFEQAATNGATPYYLVYVRENDKDDLVDAVYRDIVEVKQDGQTHDTIMADVGPENNNSHIVPIEAEGPTSLHVEHMAKGSRDASWDEGLPSHDAHHW